MTFEAKLQEAIKFHGHKCVGLVLGTRIAIAGLRMLQIQDPSDTYNLIVYVEIDRCLADAIQAITGCTIGHRRLKHVDYGKFAATFVDTSSGKGFRISVREEARNLVNNYIEKQVVVNEKSKVGQKEETTQMTEAYSKMSDGELLNVMEVKVVVPRSDLPGKPRQKETCSKCGERIFDGREVSVSGQTLCRSCAKGGYYTILDRGLG
jgi:formylmethanofuran dehydrogenase subunit E